MERRNGDGGPPMFLQKVVREDGTVEEVDVFNTAKHTINQLLRRLVDKVVFPRIACTGNGEGTARVL